MATVAEIQAEIEKVSAEFNRVQREYRASNFDNTLGTQREQLRARLTQLRAELAIASNQSAATGEFEGQDQNTGLWRYKNPVTGNSFLSDTPPTAQQQQASGINIGPQNVQPEPPATASQSAQDDAPQGPTKAAPAQVGANGRIAPPPDTTTPTNAEPTVTSETGGDSGLDAPVRTTEQTQATNGYDTGGEVRAEDGTLSNLRKNPETGELYDPGGSPGETSLATEAGTTTDDDQADNSSSTKQAEVNAANTTSIRVTPQPNVLDKYYSYSYVLSWYLLKPEQYTRLITGATKKIDGYNLLVQSGGAGVSDGQIRQPPSGSAGNPTVEPEPPAANRNPFFTNDFYIDSLTLENQLMGKGTGAAHMATSLKFTVVEPQGITLLDRLYQAVANNEPKEANGKVNYTAATYCMVIRFYGYDEAGNQVMPIRGGMIDGPASSDTRAVVEKFIPFTLTRVNWSIGSKMVTYEIEGAPIGQIQGGYTARGTVPYDVQLVDATVGGLLGQDVKFAPPPPPPKEPGKPTTANPPASQASVRAVDNAIDAQQRTPPPAQSSARSDDATPTAAPPKASAAPSKKTITQGLMGAMNSFQQDLVQRGVYGIADEYEIEFVGVDGIASAEEIEGAKLQLANAKRDLKQTPAAAPPTKSGGTGGLNPDKTAVDNVSRSFSITAGQQIVQAIELAIRNSEYISKQSLVTVNPDGTQEVNNTRDKPVKWFNITMSAERKPGGLDPKRNDYAYKIKYTVMPYILKNLDSTYFPFSRFSGVHKSYPFWFTGKNTAVKDYQETLNTMFMATISGNAQEGSLNARANEKATSSMYDIVRYNYSPRSNQSSAGADGKTFEPNANAAEIIYNASDLAQAKVRIIGDPAWIQQGSLFKPITEGSVNAATAKTGFEPDGTISFDTGDVLFEMVWQRPEDYDLSTGLADPYSRTSVNDGGKRVPLQSRVYQAIKVVSEFKNGAFEQSLEGSIYRFPIPGKSNTANPAATNSTDGAADGRPPAGSAGAGTKRPNAPRTTSGLTDAEAAAARSSFAAKDPRRLDGADGGKRAILGAQGAYKEAKFAETAGGAALGNPSITRQGITAGANLRPAGAPSPATTGAGGQVSAVAETVQSGPPKLPGGGRPVDPNSLRGRLLARQQAEAAAANPTNPAVQDIATDS